MRTSYCLSPEGIETVDNARRRKGWNRTSEEWIEAARTSASTLKRFQNGELVSNDSFISLCKAIGLEWQDLVNWEESRKKVVLSRKVENSSKAKASEPPEPPEPSNSLRDRRLLSLFGEFDEDTEPEVEFLIDHLKEFLKKSSVKIRKAS